MEYLAIGGWASAVGLAITVAIFAVRNKGLALDANRADTLRKAAEKNLTATSTNFDDYRRRAEEIEEELSEELDRYENQEIAAINAEPDQATRIKRRRRLVGGVLSKAFSPTSNDSNSGVSEDTAS